MQVRLIGNKRNQIVEKLEELYGNQSACYPDQGLVSRNNGTVRIKGLTGENIDSLSAALKLVDGNFQKSNISVVG